MTINSINWAWGADMRVRLLDMWVTLFIFFGASWFAHAGARDISKEEVVKIALHEAGCSSSADCDVQARFENGKWVCLVSFVVGRTPKGEPQFKPGQWLGLTITPEGKVVGRVPGA